MEAPCQHHLGALRSPQVCCEGSLGEDLLSEAVGVNLRSIGLHGALHAHDLEVLVLRLEEDLGIGRCDGRICRHPAPGLQNLSDREEARRHSEASFFNSLHQPFAFTGLLEEGHSELAAEPLPLVASILLASEGLVLRDVQERGSRGKLVKEASCEEGLEVVPPGSGKRVRRSRRCSASLSEELVVSRRQAQALTVQELRP